MASFARQSTMNSNPELTDLNNFRADSRRAGEVFADIVERIAPLAISLLGIMVLVFPTHGDVMCVGALIFWLNKNRAKMEYPIDAPEWSQQLTIREKFTKKTIESGRLIPKLKHGNASILYGREYLRLRVIGVNPDKETRHTLIIGSTGSGKTVLILSMLLQVLLQPGGTSAVIVDGKADIALFWKIFAMLKRVDRLHDLLVMNFLSPTDCLDTSAVHDDQKISHTMNFLNFGYPDQLKNMTMGLGRSSEGGDGDFWQGRTSTMIGAAFQYLVYERDVEGVPLDITVLRAFLPIRVMLEKAGRKDVPLKFRLPIQQYLKSLPAITDAMFEMTPQEIAAMDIYPKTDEQHIYNLMMVNETISDLSETMAHIFVTKLSEVNMTDVCLGGRVLLCLLPAIAKNTDQVAALGRLILAGLRPVLSAAAGFNLQGERFERVDNRPSSAKYPIRIFLDEYGMYGVPGFFCLAALVRSYGFHLVFGAQTAGMFKRAGGEEEYEALMGNLNSKIVLKNEDSKESLSLVQGRTGEIWVAKQDKIERKLMGSKHDNDDVRVTQTDMLTARLLASAAPGEGFFIYGGDVLPFRALNLDVPDVDSAKINYFSAIREPSSVEVNKFKRVLLNQEADYIEQANAHFENEIEQLDIPELAHMLSKVEESGFDGDTHTQLVLALGMLEISDESDDLFSDLPDEIDDENESDTSTNVNDAPPRIDTDYVNDPELQVEYANEAFQSEQLEYQTDVENFMEGGYDEFHPDYSDMPNYNDEPYENLNVDHGDYQEPILPPASLDEGDFGFLNEPPVDFNARYDSEESDVQDALNSSNIEAIASPDIYKEVAMQFKKDFAALHSGDPVAYQVIQEFEVTPESAIAETQRSIGTSQDIADREAKAVVEAITNTLLYPQGNVPERPTDIEVSDTVDQALGSLSGRF